MKLKPINLIPKYGLSRTAVRQLKEHKPAKSKGWRNLVVIISAVLLVSFIQINTANIFGEKSAKAKRAVREAQIKLSKLQSEYMELEKIKAGLAKEESLKKERLDTLLSTSSGGERYSMLLSFVAKLMPQEIWIVRFTLNEPEVRIAGSTLNNGSITEFMRRLDESKAFRNSRFIYSEKQVSDSHTIYNFQITAEPVWDTPAIGEAKDGR